MFFISESLLIKQMMESGGDGFAFIDPKGDPMIAKKIMLMANSIATEKTINEVFGECDGCSPANSTRITPPL